jgi:hypothetical protein
MRHHPLLSLSVHASSLRWPPRPPRACCTAAAATARWSTSRASVAPAPASPARSVVGAAAEEAAPARDATFDSGRGPTDGKTRASRRMLISFYRFGYRSLLQQKVI